MPLVLACAVTPANRPEGEGALPIATDLKTQGFKIAELHIDRAYVNSEVVDATERAGGRVLAKPWGLHPKAGMFSKLDFKLDLRRKTITCPAGEVKPFEPGQKVEFDARACDLCKQRSNCTSSAPGAGRTVRVAKNEERQRRFRRLQETASGREQLRERIQVEHALAHIAARKGDTARYLGVRRNLFDLRRASAIQNLEAGQRLALVA